MLFSKSISDNQVTLQTTGALEVEYRDLKAIVVIFQLELRPRP